LIIFATRGADILHTDVLYADVLRAPVLVNEAAATITPLLVSGRTRLEVSADGRINTQISIANPNPEQATVSYELRDREGTVYQSGNFVMTGTSQLSRFADELPFSSATDIEGSLTLTSTLPISVMAFRTFYNERSPSDLLLTNQPVVDLARGAPTGIQGIPHFVVGNGMKTQLLLLNSTGRQLQGRVEFVDSSGGIASVGTPLEYSVAPNSSQKLFITQETSPVEFGSILVVPTDDEAPTAMAVISHMPGDITVAEAGVPATMGTAFRMYAHAAGFLGINTAVAVSNVTPQSGTVTFSLTDMSGNFIASESLNIAPWGKITGSLDTLISSVAGLSFRGVLRVTTDLPRISVVGFRERYSERQPDPAFLFTAIVPSLETDPASSSDLIFPQFAAGEGFTSEIILYSGTAGAAGSGNLLFVLPDGTPFDPDAP
jgi:hypothetical protein